MNQTASTGPSASTEPASAGPIFTPPADILEKGDTVVLLLDVPGADPASLDVTLDKHVLTIEARVTLAAPEGYAAEHIEFQNGTYERRFVFSERMDGESAVGSGAADERVAHQPGGQRAEADREGKRGIADARPELLPLPA